METMRSIERSYCEYKSPKCLFRAHHKKRVDIFLTDIHINIDSAVGVYGTLFWKKILKHNICRDL